MLTIPTNIWFEIYDSYNRELPYHNFHHAMHVWELVRALSDDTATDELEIAALIHDSWYKPGRGDNEIFVSNKVRKGWPEIDVKHNEVARLIELTIEHQPEYADREGQILCDADMWGFQGTGYEFDLNNEAIRREYVEYAGISEYKFQLGRKAFLEKTLVHAKENKLFTLVQAPDLSGFDSTWSRNRRARVNLERLIRELYS
jgi:predicted metal-dependent HD superfamily phosphohydrolase